MAVTTLRLRRAHWFPLILAFLCVFPKISDASFAITVESGYEECLIVRAPGTETSVISGNYDCLDDDLDPIPVTVTIYNSEGQRVWQSERGASEGTFKFEGRGRHQLCVINGNSYVAQKDSEDSEDIAVTISNFVERNVGFGVRVHPLPRGRNLEKTTEDEEGPDSERAAILLDRGEQLLDDLADLMDHQAYLKLREEAHRELTERTFTRVVRWSVLEAVVLVAVASGQVLYLRKFFEQRRYL